MWAGSPAAWVLAAQGSTLKATHVAIADADRASAAGRHGWAVIALHQGIRFGHPNLVKDQLTALKGTISGELPELYLAHSAAAASRNPTQLRTVAEEFSRLGTKLLQAETLIQAALAYDSLGQHRTAETARREATAAAAQCPGARTPLLRLLDRQDTLTPTRTRSRTPGIDRTERPRHRRPTHHLRPHRRQHPRQHLPQTRHHPTPPPPHPLRHPLVTTTPAASTVRPGDVPATSHPTLTSASDSTRSSSPTPCPPQIRSRSSAAASKIVTAG